MVWPCQHQNRPHCPVPGRACLLRGSQAAQLGQSIGVPHHIRVPHNIEVPRRVIYSEGVACRV